MMGNVVATTGPDARNFLAPAAGSRKNSWLVNSIRGDMNHLSPLSCSAKTGHPVLHRCKMRRSRATSHILWLLDRPPEFTFGLAVGRTRRRAMTPRGSSQLRRCPAVVSRLQASDIQL